MPLDRKATSSSMASPLSSRSMKQVGCQRRMREMKPAAGGFRSRAEYSERFPLSNASAALSVNAGTESRDDFPALETPVCRSRVSRR